MLFPFLRYDRIHQITSSYYSTSSSIDLRLNELHSMSINDEEHDICSICLEDLQELTRVEPCDHVYHTNCIKTWSTRSKKCPKCCRQFNNLRTVQSRSSQLDRIKTNFQLIIMATTDIAQIIWEFLKMPEIKQSIMEFFEFFDRETLLLFVLPFVIEFYSKFSNYGGFDFIGFGLVFAQALAIFYYSFKCFIFDPNYQRRNRVPLRNNPNQNEDLIRL
ncbi:unnamed protein product [Ambrosiozyma monospora]|uniref:Unnamed protein product n=1 Tax=Ambrosiozyma monospora TaxID=43982 RepID=A0ACB5T698_AMBMO|nr:unnamed protein product [Ambrosiozyma monospora]